MRNPVAGPEHKSRHSPAQKAIMLAATGGLLYSGIEMLWRGRTQWAMAVLGGMLFALIGGLNEWLPCEMPLLVQAGLGAMIITSAELLFGLLVNRWLGWYVWDYSDMWGNVLGQICPMYTALWGLLSLVGIVLDDWLRHWLWGEKRPQYKLI